MDITKQQAASSTLASISTILFSFRYFPNSIANGKKLQHQPQAASNPPPTPAMLYGNTNTNRHNSSQKRMDSQPPDFR
jgi:hypothetical protein